MNATFMVDGIERNKLYCRMYFMQHFVHILWYLLKPSFVEKMEIPTHQYR